jgi:hypothetical protein
MPTNDIQSQERRETIEELAELLFVVQEMGRRLADETHGAAYDRVLTLNQHLHRARLEVEQIQASASGG